MGIDYLNNNIVLPKPAQMEGEVVEKINREELIAFAKERPPKDPEVMTMLIRWLNDTSIPAESEKEFESWERIDVEIMHIAMRYRLGFLSKNEVIAELEQAGGLLASEHNVADVHQRLSNLMHAIDDGDFEFATSNEKWFRGNSWVLPTDIDLVDPAEEAFIDRVVEAGWDRESDDVYDMRTGFREALVNAIAHGNLNVVMPKTSEGGQGSQVSIGDLSKAEQIKNPTDRDVYVTIEVDNKRVVVTIRDEGAGFDFENPPNVGEGSNILEASGRGMMVMRHYFDEVNYDKEGRRVIMVKEKK